MSLWNFWSSGARERSRTDMEFDYYYGSQADQFSFIRIPRMLLTEDTFSSLTLQSKMLYSVLLDRMSLSMKNWKITWWSEWFCRASGRIQDCRKNICSKRDGCWVGQESKCFPKSLRYGIFYLSRWKSRKPYTTWWKNLRSQYRRSVKNLLWLLERAVKSYEVII